MRIPATAFIAFIGAVAWPAPAPAGDLIWYDFPGIYLQRTDKIFPGAGNAAAANTAVLMVHPWPRYVWRRRFRSNGERMAGAVERYRDVKKLPLTPQPISPVPIGTSGFSSPGAGATAAPAAAAGAQ